MSLFLSAAWLLFVLAFMVAVARPLDMWGHTELISAIISFSVLGPGGIGLAYLCRWLMGAFSQGIREGFQDAWIERELSEAELETK